MSNTTLTAPGVRTRPCFNARELSKPVILDCFVPVSRHTATSPSSVARTVATPIKQTSEALEPLKEKSRKHIDRLEKSFQKARELQAAPIEVIEHAYKTWKLIEGRVPGFIKIRAPYLITSTDGGLIMYWDNAEVHAEVEITTDGGAEYFISFNHSADYWSEDKAEGQMPPDYFLQVVARFEL